MWFTTIFIRNPHAITLKEKHSRQSSVVIHWGIFNAYAVYSMAWHDDSSLFSSFHCHVRHNPCKRAGYMHCIHIPLCRWTLWIWTCTPWPMRARKLFRYTYKYLLLPMGCWMFNVVQTWIFHICCRILMWKCLASCIQICKRQHG